MTCISVTATNFGQKEFLLVITLKVSNRYFQMNCRNLFFFKAMYYESTKTYSFVL